MVFHWSLSDSKSPQVFKTHLSILADLNNAVVRTVSTRPVISKSSSPCTNFLVIVPRAPITIGIIVTFKFHSFFFYFRFCYYHYYCYYHCFTFWEIFSQVCTTAIFLKSVGLFSVFWPILIILYSGWYPLVFLFPSFQSLNWSFGDCSECNNYNWYYRSIVFFLQFSC